jgi:RimJ/RimL family protein N-acetyltransferase
MAWWEDRLKQDRGATDVVFGAFRDGHLAGAAGLNFETREKARHKCTLFGMYVPEEFRQGGLGRAIVEALLDEARSRPGVKVIQLTVSDGNRAAQSLYERCGFVQFGLEPLAIAVGPRFVSKVHMWRRLDDAQAAAGGSPSNSRMSADSRA